MVTPLSPEPTTGLEPRDLTSGRALARSTALHFTGQALPLLIGVLVLPDIVRELGQARVGIVTLAWAALGYFSVFDLGLGRALTQQIATRLGRRDLSDIAALFWNSTWLMVSFAIVGAILFALSGPFVVYTLLDIPHELQSEALSGILLLAVTLPFIVHAAACTGLLTAHQRFGVLSVIRAPMASLMFLGPFIAAQYSQSVLVVMGTLAAARCLGWLCYLSYCLWAFPELRRVAPPRFSVAKPLVRLGSWMTVSNVVSPAMVYLDRVVLGALVPITRMTYYAVPCEVLTKLWIIPGTVVSVLFPAFATSLANDRGRCALLYQRAVRYILYALFPVGLTMIAMAPEGLSLWLGEAFATEATSVVRLLTLGIFVNGVGVVAVGFLQAAGRPDAVAKLHLVELPFYFAGLWYLTGRFGISGAAIAWTLRIAVDSVVLCYLVDRLGLFRLRLNRDAAVFAAGIVLLSCGFLPTPADVRLGFVLVTLIGFVLWAWWYGLTADERSFVTTRLTRPQQTPS